MKNQILFTLTFFTVLAITMSSCSKNAKNPLCQTCTIDTSPDVRVELCEGVSTTYSGNLVLFEEDISGLSISFYASLLESSGYKCK